MVSYLASNTHILHLLLKNHLWVCGAARAMNSETSNDDLFVDIKSYQKNILLEMIKQICSDNKLSTKVRGKVSRLIADCYLTHHYSLHKLSTADESTSTLLGFMHKTSTELTYDEQAELNHAIIKEIQNKIPTLTQELETLRQTGIEGKKSRRAQMRDLQESLNDKLNTLQEQENEKVELMMEWLNHRLSEVNRFSDHSSELLTLKTRILELKSKILHLQILQNIFTETNKSIEAYSEIHKDLKDSIEETEQRIKHFKDIIESDYK